MPTIMHHLILACIVIVVALFLVACLLAGVFPKTARQLAQVALAFFCAVFTFLWHLFLP